MSCEPAAVVPPEESACPQWVPQPDVLARAELLSERFGEPPVLLIDDWTAELDPQRRQFLLDLAASVPQAIVTGTEQPPGAQLALQAAAGRFTPQPRQEEMPA